MIFLRKFYYVKISYPAKFDEHYLYLSKEKIKLSDILEVKLLTKDLYRITVEGSNEKYYYESTNWDFLDWFSNFSFNFNKKSKELIRRINIAKEDS
jgi:hypothetical protein